MKKKCQAYLDRLVQRYPELEDTVEQILRVFNVLTELYESDGILFICGNGGSASDAEHITGELMKGFRLERKIDKELADKLESKLENGRFISENLQRGLRAISLTSHPSLSTAYSNDVESELVFAQQLFVLGRKTDVLMGISTSGNSKNVLRCMELASVIGIKTILLTGRNGGKCADFANFCVRVPADKSDEVQEYHLPIYHTLCLMLEEYFYG